MLLLIVHCKIVVPLPIPIKAVVSKVGVVIIAVPDNTVQKPVPSVGLLPVRVAVGEQMY